MSAQCADPWEQRKFSDLAVLKRGLTYSPKDIVQPEEGVRVLRSSNIKNSQFVLNNDDVFVRDEAVTIECAKDGDILITAANGSTGLVGKHGRINRALERMVQGGFMLMATSDDSEFLNPLMETSWYKRFLRIGVYGGNGSIGNLDKDALSNQELLVPGLEERRRIGGFFNHLDSLITLHQRKELASMVSCLQIGAVRLTLIGPPPDGAVLALR